MISIANILNKTSQPGNQHHLVSLTMGAGISHAKKNLRLTEQVHI